MPHSEEFMIPDQVQRIAQGFENIANVLKAVSTALEACMMVLRATAFIGLVGGTAVERYLAAIKPEIDKMQAKCAEISGDMQASVTKWLKASEAG